MLANRPNIQVGGLFIFGSRTVGWAAAQVAYVRPYSFYIGIFDKIFGEIPNLDNIESQRVLLSGWTQDAKFYNGDWTIVGSKPIHAGIPMQVYGTRVEGRPAIEEMDGTLRPISNKTEESLAFRKVVAPIRFEKAFYAFHGRADWDPSYRELLIERDRVRPSAQ